MQSGILHLMDGDMGKIHSFNRTIDKRGFDAKICLDITQEFTNNAGETIVYQGQAAEEFVTESDSVDVDEETDSISVSQVPQLNWRHTNFLYTPEGILVIESSSGDFLTTLLKEKFDVGVEKAQIHLSAYQSFLEDTRDDVEPWKIGFYGHEGNADNGVVHGRDLQGDETLGALLSDNEINQLGLEFKKENARVKLFVAESGYLEIYQPSDIGDDGFIAFIEEDIMPHLRMELSG